jgi:dihydroneopterin aldolase
MTIHIENLKFQCIIGILDFERDTSQDVIVNIQVDYNNKNDFINYVDIVQIIKKMMIDNKFSLIEDAIKEIILKLTKEFSSIKNINLKITKPSILPECMVSVSNYYKSQS